jgi:hypothetical protein
MRATRFGGVPDLGSPFNVWSASFYRRMIVEILASRVAIPKDFHVRWLSALTSR